VNVLAVVPQRPPDNWPARATLTTAVLVAFVLLVWWARRTWKRRAAAHSDLLPLPSFSGEFADVAEPADGLYVGSTQAGGWQERVYAGGLGNRAAATLHTLASGVVIERDAMEPLFIPRAAIKAVRLDAGLANKVVGSMGLLVVTWEQNGFELDSGFRADHRLDNIKHSQAIEGLLSKEHTA
jgi:hypothetical protein